MNPVLIDIDIVGLAESESILQRLRSRVANRREMNAAIASDAEKFTKAYVAGSDRHASAQRLGATPTGFRERASKRIESAFDDSKAIVRIPRSTGLGRAFGDVVIRPGSGRTYLTLPGCAETYGKVVRDFPTGTFAFTIMAGRYPVLVWREDGQGHRAWTLAYWLRREVVQKQDRTLLPSDAAYQEIGRRRVMTIIHDAIRVTGDTDV